MRKLALAFLFLGLMASFAFGHNGALSLYLNQTISQCDSISNPFDSDTMRLYYVRDQGPEMGNAAEFRMELTNPLAIFNPPPVWSTLITVILGDIENGIAITAGNCLGVNQAVTYLGEIYVFNLGIERDTQYRARVIDHPISGGIFITRCDIDQTIAPVLGGTFIFNGSCNPSVDVKSWGAIKSLYR